jgi:spore maturation protein CgeB
MTECMTGRPLNIVIFGLSISSSWGNGHATVYRALMRALCDRGHDVLFLERDVPWYAAHRDLPKSPTGRLRFYSSNEELKNRYTWDVENADLCIVGSYVPEGCVVADWVTQTAKGVTAFYDIDTPITLTKLAAGDTEYISPQLVPKFDLYLSFTGGPSLRLIERKYGSPRARAFYCSVDTSLYFPEAKMSLWDMGYMGTYSADRQGSLEKLLLEPARRKKPARAIVAGPLYPPDLNWPANVEHVEHIAPGKHRDFYNSQRFTLNLTRADMIAAGYSPSVRLFEAAACATPIISDYWSGLETFFIPGKEILVAATADDVVAYLSEITEGQRVEIGLRARAKILARHTSEHRVRELESHVAELTSGRTTTLDAETELVGAVA